MGLCSMCSQERNCRELVEFHYCEAPPDRSYSIQFIFEEQTQSAIITKEWSQSSIFTQIKSERSVLIHLIKYLFDLKASNVALDNQLKKTVLLADRNKYQTLIVNEPKDNIQTIKQLFQAVIRVMLIEQEQQSLKNIKKVFINWSSIKNQEKVMQEQIKLYLTNIRASNN